MNARVPPSEFALRKCFGKEAFDRLSEAQRAARRINGSVNRRRPVKAYRCCLCGMHHFGGGHRKD